MEIGRSRKRLRHSLHSAVGRLCQEKEKDGCDRDGRSENSLFDGKELNEATSTIGEPIIGSARQPKFSKEIDTS